MVFNTVVGTLQIINKVMTKINIAKETITDTTGVNVCVCTPLPSTGWNVRPLQAHVILLPFHETEVYRGRELLQLTESPVAQVVQACVFWRGLAGDQES